MNTPENKSAGAHFDGTTGRITVQEPLATLHEPPKRNIVFHLSNGKDTATLEWTDGTMRFMGNADESARVFATALGLQLSEKMTDYERALMNCKSHPELAAKIAEMALAKWRPQP